MKITTKIWQINLENWKGLKPPQRFLLFLLIQFPLCSYLTTTGIKFIKNRISIISFYNVRGGHGHRCNAVKKY